MLRAVVGGEIANADALLVMHPNPNSAIFKTKNNNFSTHCQKYHSGVCEEGE
jgi:hypothetical protein